MEAVGIVASSEPPADTAGIALLLIRFSDAVDQRRPAEVPELFTVDGVFRPAERSMHGRQAIGDFYAARLSDERRRSRHLWSNLLVRPIRPLLVRFSVVLTNFAFEPVVSELDLQMRIGNVAGTCESDPHGNWRFAEHLYERLFATSLPLAGGGTPAART
jgi:hypothetical protein